MMLVKMQDLLKFLTQQVLLTVLISWNVKDVMPNGMTLYNGLVQALGMAIFTSLQPQLVVVYRTTLRC